MIILTNSTGEQNLQFIPRKFVISGSLIIRDEETDITQTHLVGVGSDGFYATISVALSLELNKFYEMKLLSLGSDWENVFQLWNNATINWEQGITPIGSTWATAEEDFNLASSNWEDTRESLEETIYKDRIFCTNQTISQRASEYYDPIKGLYKKSTSRDNTYKVYNG